MTHRISACALLGALFASTLPVHAQTASSQAGNVDPVLQRVFDALVETEHSFDGMSWDSRSRDADGSFVYTNVVASDSKEKLTADVLRVSGETDTGPVTISAEGISVEGGSQTLSLDSFSTIFDPEDLAALDAAPEGEDAPSHMELACEFATSGMKLDFAGLDAEQASGARVTAASFGFDINAKTIADRCLGLLKIEMSDWSFAKDGNTASIGAVTIGSLQLFDDKFIDVPTGIDYRSMLEVSDVRVDVELLPAPVTVDRVSSSSLVEADSMIALAQSGIDDLIAWQPPLRLQTIRPEDRTNPTQPAYPTAPDVDNAEVWNAVRELVSDVRFEIDGVQTDLSALAVLPETSPLRGPLSASAAFNGQMDEGTVTIDIEKKASSLADVEAGLVLELGESPQLNADMPPQLMVMRLPVKLARLEAELDEKGLDQVLRQMTGRGLEASVTSQLSMLQPDQKAVITDWLTAAKGEGNSAELILEPDQPQMVQSLAPLLFGDWVALGNLLNARTER